MKAITRFGALLARNNLRPFSHSSIRCQQPSGNFQEGWIYIDSVFPIRLGAWDIRYFLGVIRQDNLVERLRFFLSSVDLHDFELVSLEPQVKDGGVFVRFKYRGLDNPGSAVSNIQERLREQIEEQGSLPSWNGLGRSNIWVVKGDPWREDMNRFALQMLKVTFDGPDVQEESLYQLFRPYGRILNISPPAPVPAGTLRSARITFKYVRSATIARNVLHGFRFSSEQGHTRLGAGYERPLQAHVVREWMAKHPKIVLPIVFFLLGTLTYTIFDPIRTVMVQGKVMNWFDYRESKVYKWIRENALDRIGVSHTSSVSSDFHAVWKERIDAEAALKVYLSDLPTTLAFVYGPQGSGKSRMVSKVVDLTGRRTLTIDCAAIYKHHDSDSKMVATLAQQTGYWPIFSFLASVNNMIDLASVGIIGQKAGLSSSLTDQCKEILEVVGRSLGRVASSHQERVQHMIKEREQQRQREERMGRVQRGEWHDGRMDCVAGNGVMSELGIGDERFGVNDWDVAALDDGNEKEDVENDRRQTIEDDMGVVNSLPVVIIRNYEDRSVNKDEVLDVLAQWAAMMVENQVAHVIIMSDNRENSKRLAKALPSKPLNFVALSDADSATALSFVQQKLKDANMNVTFTSETTADLGRLGGRASDLESLVYKVRSGFSIEDAVEDIINRGVGELRKNAFGDDADDAKNLPWSREQAWGLVKRLATQTEIPYYDALIDFPFKGDETALRNMEHAELITVTTFNGRPSMIRPGKPVYKYVYQRVVGDPIFSATQDLAFNTKLISIQESTIRACEEELSSLTDIGDRTRSSIWGEDRAVSSRIRYLFKKMGEAEGKIEGLEKVNARLKKSLISNDGR